MTDLSPACDYPTCVGGECSYDCERYVKHLEWCKEEYSERIETLTRENAALEAERDEWKLCCEVETGLRREFLTRAEAAESALREALDVTRNLLRRIDNHFNSYPEWDWQEQTAARAFIEKHAPAATSEDK